MRDILELAIVDVQHLRINAVAGHDDQAELTIVTKRGSLTLRLIPRSDRTIRLTDLRSRDKRRRKKVGIVSVPFADR